MDPRKFQLINRDQLLLHEKMVPLQGGNHEAAYGTVGLERAATVQEQQQPPRSQ